MSAPPPGRVPGLAALEGAPPVALLLAAVASVQLGGALAATLIPRIGVMGSVTLRLGLASLALLLLVRPAVRGRSRGDWMTAAAFGLSLAAMNSAFYGSLGRLPIGVAVTIEFLGPLVLAALTSRTLRDAGAVAAALLGVVLMSGALTQPWSQLDHLGIALALLAGACWAAYILLSGRTGARFAGLDGMALAMTAGTLIALPAGLAGASSALADPSLLAAGAGVSLLSSAIPYSLELVALRRMSPGVFGTLLSLEPAAAALAGLVVLGQRLTPTQLGGMALVVLASVLVLGVGRRGG